MMEQKDMKRNEKIEEKNKRIIRKMNRYIDTFPLKAHEIALIQKDIAGMAVEANERGELLENVLGKSPREFCDELMYAVGGIKAPGGRKLLRFAGAYYEIAGFALLFFTGLNLGFMCYRGFGSCVFGDCIELWIWIDFLLREIILLSLGGLIYAAGKKMNRYSSDVSRTIQAVGWGVGMLLLGIILQIISMKYARNILGFFEDAQEILVYMEAPCFVLWICESVACIIGAIRNRPHMET